MQEAAQNLLLVLVTLFPIVDPLGGSPLFLALTREYSPEARKAFYPLTLPLTVGPGSILARSRWARTRLTITCTIL
jgi:small neutral amino acid transporter SnatA (MarC family)